MLIVGSRNVGFEATFRLLTYLAVTNLVSWISFIVGILSLCGIYLGIIGIREAHNTTTRKAAVVVLITAAIIILLLVLALIALVVACLFLRYPAVADYDTQSGVGGVTCAVSGR